jgi:protein-L-isoaspartate(D-aspartate) O-methyltransferase
MTLLDLTGIGMTSLRTRERLVSRLTERGIRDERVLDVMRNTPRHIFLDEALAHKAYEDTALPIGFSQTLSQPYIVAKMTELLIEHGRPKKVLEIGTGSGYQCAVLAQVADEVFSVERIRPLQQKARQRMRLLKLHNVRFKHADGGFGWPENGPYDAILSAAAPESVPDDLTHQLAVGGRLLMPVGDYETQQLIMIERTEDGFEQQVIEAVRFVPLLAGVMN